MGQFSVEKPVLPGSALSGNQQRFASNQSAMAKPEARLTFRCDPKCARILATNKDFSSSWKSR
jgi:hypothetical protein